MRYLYLFIKNTLFYFVVSLKVTCISGTTKLSNLNTSFIYFVLYRGLQRAVVNLGSTLEISIKVILFYDKVQKVQIVL